MGNRRIAREGWHAWVLAGSEVFRLLKLPTARASQRVEEAFRRIGQVIDAGIGRFCDSCRACRKFCPADAIPDRRSPEAGADHLGYDRYMVDTGRCFPYFAKYSYCSICLPVCVYNHKEWARDFEDGRATQSFPTVIMLSSPPASDLPDSNKRHDYPKIRRGG